MSAAPMYIRAVVVFDAQALMGESAQKPDWTDKASKDELITRIKEAFSAGEFKDSSPVLVPVCLPGEGGLPLRWEALVIEMGGARNSLHLAMGELDRALQEYPNYFARQAQECLGVECAAITQASEYEEAAIFIAELIDSHPIIFYPSSDLTSSGIRMTPDMDRLFKTTYSALRSSHLRKTLLDGLGWNDDAPPSDVAVHPKF